MIAAGITVSTGSAANLVKLQIATMGDVFVLIATITWATTAIAMRKYLLSVNAGVVTFYRFSISALLLCLYTAVMCPVENVNIYQFIVGVVVAAGTIFYYEGLKRLKAAQVSALEITTLLFSAGLAYYTLGEKVTILQAIGIALLGIGVITLTRKEEYPT